MEHVVSYQNTFRHIATDLCFFFSLSGIDDYTAKEMGAEMIVHYGHSCLSKP